MSQAMKLIIYLRMSSQAIPKHAQQHAVAFALTTKTPDLLSLAARTDVGISAGAGASVAFFLRPQNLLHLFASSDSTTKTGRQSLAVFEVFMLTHVHATYDCMDLALWWT